MRGGIHELCCETLPYINDSGGPAQYKQGNVSLPAAGPKADLTAVLPAEHCELLMRPDVHMLHESAHVETLIADSGLRKPFVDPAFRSQKNCATFLIEVLASGIISFGSYRKPLLGLFFVPAKDGRLRLFFDTRICNCFFKPPPKTRLPTAAAMGSVSAVLKTTCTLLAGISITPSIDVRLRRRLENISLYLASKPSISVLVTSTDFL